MENLIFEHYEVLTDEAGDPVVLGTGGMGVTYRAWDTHLGRELALKIIRPSWLEEPLAKERFIREARAIAQIQHPNVVGIVHLGETTDGCYYTMEFIDGMTLEEKVKSEGPLDVGWALFIGRQMASALNAATKRDIVHRDIKPANIMLVEDDEDGLIAKLIDFGLARNFIPASEESTAGPLTMDGSVLGTPHYASPEQIEEQELDVRSDIYSLGICLFYALSGQIPFEGKTANVMFAQVHEEPNWAKLTVPDRVLALLKRMLQKDREDRFPNALALFTEIDALLRDALRGSGDEKLSTIISRQASKPTSPHTNPITPLSSGSRTEPQPARDKKSIPLAYWIGGGVLILLAGAALWSANGNRSAEKDSPKENEIVLEDSSKVLPPDRKPVKAPKEAEVEPTGKVVGKPDPEPSESTGKKDSEVAAGTAKESEKGSPPVVAETKPGPKKKSVPKVVGPVEKETIAKKESAASTVAPPDSKTASSPAAKQPVEWEIAVKNARKVRADLVKEYSGQLAELNEFYLKALNGLMKEMTENAKLDQAIVVDREIKRVEAATIENALELPDGGKPGKVPRLDRFQKIYVERGTPVHAEFVVKRDAVLDAYKKLLEGHEATLKNENKLSELERLRKEKREIFGSGL